VERRTTNLSSRRRKRRPYSERVYKDTSQRGTGIRDCVVVSESVGISHATRLAPIKRRRDMWDQQSGYIHAMSKLDNQLSSHYQSQEISKLKKEIESLKAENVRKDEELKKLKEEA